MTIVWVSQKVVERMTQEFGFGGGGGGQGSVRGRSEKYVFLL